MTRTFGSVLLLAVVAWAAPEADQHEREIREIRGQLERLRGEAMERHEQRKFEESRELARKSLQLMEVLIHRHLVPLAELRARAGKEGEAKRIQDEIHRVRERMEELRRHMEQDPRDRGNKEREDPRRILEGLERGIGALQALGRHDEAEHLERLANEVRQRMRRREANRKEIEIAEQRLEVMRLAIKAFREAEKSDAAEALEKAIHALELRVEGRDDPEARKIRGNAPELGQQVELLLYAGDLWEEFGHERKAAMCTELGRELQEIFLRKNKNKKKGRGRGEAAAQRTIERIEQLEERMKRMERSLEEIVDLLRRQRD